MGEATTIQTVGEDAGGIEPWDLMDRLDNQLLDPQNAARMVTGLRPDTLVYIVRQSGGKPDIVGVSANGAQVLAVRYGRLETLPEVSLTEIQIPVTVNGPDGEMEELVQGVRAMVRVRDMRSGTTFVGIDDEPCYVLFKNGGRKPDTKAAVKATNKAERNALNKHFAAIEEVVRQFAEEAKRKGQAYIVDSAEEQAAAKQPIPPRPAGPPVCGAAEVDRINALRKAAGIKGEQFQDWLAGQGMTFRTIPVNRVGEIESYIKMNGHSASAAAQADEAFGDVPDGPGDDADGNPLDGDLLAGA